jgi:hypothetical protein
MGKVFDPPFPRPTSRDERPEQQAQPALWEAFRDDSVRGACALRSLVAWASRDFADKVERCGAVKITRGAAAPHFEHSDGSSHSAIGRIRVNGPQSLQQYS